MKKLLVFLWALLAVSASVKAQGLTATLQQGDKMTPFYGPDAFIQAYSAAQKGAVITLSAGTFNTVDSITKQVTIIGNGAVGEHATRLSGSKLTIDNRSANLIVCANKVHIEGIQCGSYKDDWKSLTPGGICLRNVSDTHIKNCFVVFLLGTHQHTNTVIDQCYIHADISMSNSLNACYKNSFLSFPSTGEYRNSKTNPILFLNCLIFHWYDVTTYEGYTPDRRYAPWGTYTNCILGQRYYNYSWLNSTNEDYWRGYDITPVLADPIANSNLEFYNSVFFLWPYKHEKDASGNWTDEVYDDLKSKEMLFDMVESQTRRNNTSSTWSTLFDDDAVIPWEMLRANLPYTGDDGTVVGPYGGTGFSLTPSIPRIVESKIDSYTDADGKLNVKIKVEAGK